MPYRDPDKARDYQREYRRMQRAGEYTTPRTTPLPVPFRLKTAADVIGLLEEQISAVRDKPKASTLEQARCIGYLAGISLKAIEAGDFAARLEALEAILKERKKAG